MSRAARFGAFLVFTLAILVAGVFIIGGKQYLFSSTYQLKAQFDNVEGLDAGGDVRVGGVHTGTVRNIVLPHKPGEKVTVLMDLDRSTHEIIKQDSIVTIETEGLLGNQYLSISFGSAASDEVRNGDTIASQPPLEMSTCCKKPATSSIAASKPSRMPPARRRIWTRSAPKLMAAKVPREPSSTTSSFIAIWHRPAPRCATRWPTRKPASPTSRRTWKP